MELDEFKTSINERKKNSIEQEKWMFSFTKSKLKNSNEYH